MEARRFTPVIGLALLIHAPAAAQDARGAGDGGGAGMSPAAGPRVVAAQRLTTGTPAVDGALDEPVWRLAPVAGDFLQREPAEGAAPSERTEVRVAYDDRTLYIGARLFDSRPDSIRSALARRDTDTPSDELWVALDSYDDRRTAFVFAVNPSGSKRDWLVYDGSRVDPGWDAVWAAATRADSLGWTVELAIPLNQLRFSVGEDGAGRELEWGVNFMRRIARRNEYDYWSLVPRDAPERVAHYGRLRGLELDRAPRRVEVRPYTVGRMTRAPVEPGDPFRSPRAWDGEVGLDAKLGVTSDLTLTATVNPDFGQVEADPSRVNLSTIEIQLPERRPFFVEGAELFNAGFPSPFYSRRIGRAPQGAAPARAEHVDAPARARILAAVKLSGKTAGGWSVGVLDAVTGAATSRWVDGEGRPGSSAVEPLTNYAVARAARDFRDGRSMLGVIGTATNRRIDDPELRFLRESAYVLGLDGRHRAGDYYVWGSAVTSTVRGDTSAIARTQRAPLHSFQRPDADHLDYDPTRTALSGWGTYVEGGKEAGGPWRFGAGGAARSPGLELNDLGYQRNTDIATAFAWLGYERYGLEGPFRRVDAWLNQWNAWSFGGEPIGREVRLNGSVQLRNFWDGWFHIGHVFEVLQPGALRGGPALVWDGMTFGTIGFGSPSTHRFTTRFQLNGNRANEGGGGALGASVTVGYRPTPGVDLSVAPRVDWNRDPRQYVATLADDAGGPDHYVLGRLRQTTASLTLRANYTLSPTLSFELYAQPFISAGRYTRFIEAVDPGASAFDDRFQRLDAAYDDELGNPDFTVRELNTNAVLRWEYRPGSTLFVVWSQSRSAFDRHGRFDLRHDAPELLDAPATHVLLVKLSYWLDG